MTFFYEGGESYLGSDDTCTLHEIHLISAEIEKKAQVKHTSQI